MYVFYVVECVVQYKAVYQDQNFITLITLLVLTLKFQ